MRIKLILALIFAVVALLYFILPRTRFSQKLKMNIRVFYVMNLVGIICGTFGIVVSFAWPDLVLEKHYFELILLPVLIFYVYSAILGKSEYRKDLYDEKQNLNMTQAAAVTWPMSIVIVFLLFAMYKEEILTGPVFFPVFIFSTLTFYSASTLYLFKKN